MNIMLIIIVDPCSPIEFSHTTLQVTTLKVTLCSMGWGASIQFTISINFILIGQSTEIKASVKLQAPMINIWLFIYLLMNTFQRNYKILYVNSFTQELLVNQEHDINQIKVSAEFNYVFLPLALFHATGSFYNTPENIRKPEVF